jgi:hypothetical protein
MSYQIASPHAAGVKRKEDGNGMSPTRAMPSVRRETIRGNTIAAHGREITPIARVVTLAWPGGRVVRKAPVAIEVHERGQTRRIPIRDATPRAFLALVLVEVVLGAFIWRALMRRKMPMGRWGTFQGKQKMSRRRRVSWIR